MTGSAAKSAGSITVDPRPTFDLSPYLFMQFMEALGDSDPSLEAGWDFARNRWRDDLVQVTRRLAPSLIRWPGGTLTSFYRWKEAVGPRQRRRMLFNTCWGGVESNQIGTHEFMDFCRLVKADPLMVVNFESDGARHWMRDPSGSNRCAGPREAAEWVDYCNNPANARRRRNGASRPFDVRLWQIGNETSYSPAAYDCETAARRTVAFARAMRKADPDIRLIGWGDYGHDRAEWAPRMLEIAGEHLQYIAFHHHWDSGLKNSPLRPNEYRRDPARTWCHLMHAHKSLARRIRQMRRLVSGYGVRLAMTEGHFSLPGHDRGRVLASWAAGVANALALNVQVRNGDILKIATLADFCGSLWHVNAIMLPTPARFGRAYMMPVASVMALYRKHTGRRALPVLGQPHDLDVTASRSGRKVFLFVVNTGRTRAVRAKLVVEGAVVESGRVFEIAADPTLEVNSTEPDLFAPVTHRLEPGTSWRFPAASVSAVELAIR